MQEETDQIRQFTTDFPEIYVLENEKQKTDRLRRAQSQRKIPQGILRTLRKGVDEIKEQVDKDNQLGFPLLSYGILSFIALVLYLIWDKLSEKMEGGASTKRGSTSSQAAWGKKYEI
ncbi:hypothetical protein FGO68_gene14521 [Halteria grandinella]|uniref:Uncharacterized protein n=1 Tax=Halteria grandinella TaxID=5974 RepID=A0A8J8NE78_HALGN|nr:hypothetical protein FGO68_gene14521 [Halteria grandinella]